MDAGRPRDGDIIVTAVGEHYAIGRLKADGEMQEYLQSQEDRGVPLRQACALAGTNHRVFLYPRGTTVRVLSQTRSICLRVTRPR
jgi:hypothetical protein